MNIAFFGSSLLSAYWNGAATYYRGIIRALDELGHRVTFYEPDAFDRQLHRDIETPGWARSIVYSAEGEREVWRCLDEARSADLIVKASGVGVFDDLLDRAILDVRHSGGLTAYWDVDAPATLDAIRSDPRHHLHDLVPRYDFVFTYGGGAPVVNAYREVGARACIPIYNALDPQTHFPTGPDSRFSGDLGFLGNRLPDREIRVDEFFFRAAALSPGRTFLLGGNGWTDKAKPESVRYIGHVYTTDHNAFNCTPTMVLNISRESMARYGFSPATRVFEAAGAAACLITDSWEGIEMFLEPCKEVLVAHHADDVAKYVRDIPIEKARKIGVAAQQRVMTEHTYSHRGRQLDHILRGRAVEAIGR